MNVCRAIRETAKMKGVEDQLPLDNLEAFAGFWGKLLTKVGIPHVFVSFIALEKEDIPVHKHRFFEILRPAIVSFIGSVLQDPDCSPSAVEVINFLNSSILGLLPDSENENINGNEKETP